MNNSGKQRQSVSDREVDEQQKSNDDSSPESSGAGEGSSTAISGDSVAMRSGNDIGIADRLTDLLVGDGDRDSDLLMQRNTQDEGTVMQWLLALDMQVMGACRADERLKPLLKVNASSSGAEDRLLSHLSQHFEPSEVGLLARCLCIPLASVRVGKIKKQGTLLTPTGTRGNLVISLLPTSDLRISFLADDGYTDTLSILRNISDCSSVMIEGIPTDISGRSFAVRIPSKDPFYFWCSEKSRLLGNELLEKMKNLLERKPSLAELTGISDSRLERFVHHLRINFLGSNSASEAGQSSQSQNLLSKPSRPRSCNFQVVLSPRPSSFKLRRRTDGGRSETSEKHAASCPSTSNNGKRKLLDSSSGTCLFPSLPMPSSTPAHQISPYYCWCPPVVSVTTLQTEPFTLPPLSSLFPSLPMPLSTSVPQISPPYYCWCPPVSVTTLQTEPFTLPPLSSLLPMPSPNLSEIPILPLSMSASSQVFTPLICDPIVHLPVIDICSSGQAYLVNSGPAINVSIPPRHNQFVQETTESEKSARDTLRVLISGSGQMFTPLMCNPIVHLPVIDICSSGQAYLVNSGPAISVSIPPLHTPFVQETMESERSIRDTLQVLISRSGQFPSVVAKSDGDTNVITGMGLVSARRCIEQSDLVETGGVGLGQDDPSEESSSRE